MKVKIILLLIFIQFVLVSSAYSAEDTGSTIAQMDQAEIIIYGESRRGGLIDRLNELERVLFGRSLPGTLSERQMQLVSFIKTGNADQPSLLFKLGVAEWAVSQSIQPFLPALGRLQKLEQELDDAIQEGRPIAMRVERILSLLFTDIVTQTEIEVSSDKVIRAKILEDIGPGKSRKGDSVKIELMEDFIIDNFLIAPRGSRIVSEIASVTRPGAFGRAGEVRLEFKYLQILGPEEPKVKLADDKKLGGTGEKNIVAAVGSSMIGAALLGPLGLATGLLIRGDSLDVNAETQFYVQQAEGARMSVFPIPASLNRNADQSDRVDADDSDEIIILDNP
ncbi:MAG: hypothetical protein FWH52_00750 [Synergistaceae bacterium]|nr:hypothetical protein [Synergistaceae bacterium]